MAQPRAANFEQLELGRRAAHSWTARVGRSKDTARFERLYYLEASHAKVTSDALSTSSEAVSANYHWLKRDLDNILAPTEGYAWSLQGGVGVGRGVETRADEVGEARSRGPFVRAYTRYNWYRPFGRWFANARVEAGEVFVKKPDLGARPILFAPRRRLRARLRLPHARSPRNGAVVAARCCSRQRRARASLSSKMPALLGASSSTPAMRRPLGRHPPGLRLRGRVHYAARSALRSTSPTARVQKVRVHISVASSLSLEHGDDPSPADTLPPGRPPVRRRYGRWLGGTAAVLVVLVVLSQSRSACSFGRCAPPPAAPGS